MSMAVGPTTMLSDQKTFQNTFTRTISSVQHVHPHIRKNLKIEDTYLKRRFQILY